MFEGLFQPMHLLLIFLVALLVFGPKNLPALGKSLGESIREFKKAIAPQDDRSPTPAETQVKQNELKRIE